MESVANLEPIAVKYTTAAKMLDCSACTVWRLVRRGKLDTIKIGEDDRVTVASLKRLASAQEGAA
jgi:hypothetical protein